MKQLTARDVIRERQEAIRYGIMKVQQEIADIDDQVRILDEKNRVLAQSREKLMIEYDVLESFEEGRKIPEDSTKDIFKSSKERMQTADRLSFEDCLYDLMNQAGRALQFAEIRGELEKFGFKWNNYGAAYNYISRQDMITKTDKKGWYILRDERI